MAYSYDRRTASGPPSAVKLRKFVDTWSKRISEIERDIFPNVSLNPIVDHIANALDNLEDAKKKKGDERKQWLMYVSGELADARRELARKPELGPYEDALKDIRKYLKDAERLTSGTIFY